MQGVVFFTKQADYSGQLPKKTTDQQQKPHHHCLEGFPERFLKKVCEALAH